MRPPIRRLLWVTLGLVIGLGAFGVAHQASTACTPFARSPCIRVLFLGNSYTYVNDLPGTFRDLARAAGQNVETGMVASGGESLADHAASAQSTAAVSGSAWAFVVLQEQSEIPAVEDFRLARMAPAARSLVGLIRAAGASPVLFETWAHRDGWVERGLDYAAMQSAIDAGYRTIGTQLGVSVARVGEAWQTLLREDPTISLWQADHSHPTAAGTYLAAVVLYTTILGTLPDGVSDDGGLPPGIARTLRLVGLQR